jgi:hypothetical protein
MRNRAYAEEVYFLEQLLLVVLELTHDEECYSAEGYREVRFKLVWMVSPVLVLAAGGS